MSRSSRLSVLLLALLGGCALLAPEAEDAEYAAAGGWLEFGVRAQNLSSGEFQASLSRARASYRAEPSAAAAIRLAILLTSPRNSHPDAGAAEMLLAEVQGSAAAGAEDRVFADFYRPVAARIAAQQADLESARAQVQVLSGQLDALRDLEEQLDAED